MDFSYSDEQQAAIELARKILTDHCTPQRLRALDLAGGHRFDKELWSKLAEAGLLAAGVPEAHGGAGLGFLVVAGIVVGVSVAARDTQKERSLLLILLDSSKSMTIQDEFNGQNRWDAQRRTLQRCEPVLQQLRDEQNIDVRIYRFAEQVADFDPKDKAEGNRTDVGTALAPTGRETARA